jgi:hypothetical protein
MLAYSELKLVIDYILNSGLADRVFHNVSIWDGGNGERFPAYKHGDDFLYVGIDDRRKMNCYIRQTGDVSKLSMDLLDSCSKSYITRIPYRFVFFNDFERRDFDYLHEWIISITLKRNIDFVRFITDAARIKQEETIVKGFIFGGTTFYCALDLMVAHRVQASNCVQPIECESLPNPFCGKAETPQPPAPAELCCVPTHVHASVPSELCCTVTNVSAHIFEHCCTVTVLSATTMPLTQTKFTAQWGWSATPFTSGMVAGFSYQKSGIMQVNGVITADYVLAPVNNYLIVRYPITETEKLTWFNTSLNQGTIPDQVYETPYSDANYHYAWTRVTPALAGTQSITYS